MLCHVCPQDASTKAVAAFTGASATGNYLQLRDGRFIDDRWVGGRWDLSKFAAANGETDWDAVSAARSNLRLCCFAFDVPHNSTRAGNRRGSGACNYDLSNGYFHSAGLA